MKETVDVDKLIQMIADRLCTWSGEGIAAVAKDIMGDDYEVTYEGDSFFEIDDRRN